MNKLDQFKLRNRKRNSHLYLEGLVEGLDYVTCPVSGERLSMIRNDYIVKILNMDPIEYWNRYPNVPRCSVARQHNIKTGLAEIDTDTGLTKHQKSIIKSNITKHTADESGKTVYQKIGEKTRAAHMANVDELGRNGYSQAATKNIIKGNATKAQKGLILPPQERNLYYRYKNVVLYLTLKNRSALLQGQNIKLGKAGDPGAYHVDHKYSIYQAWKSNLSPIVVGSLHNLQLLPWKENISKYTKSSIDMHQLLQDAGISYEDNIKQWNVILKIIMEDSAKNVPSTGAFVLERYYESVVC